MIPTNGDLVDRLRGLIKDRMVEIGPQVGEAKCLQETLEILDRAIEGRDKLLAKIAEIKPAATKANVNTWAKTLDPDLIVRAADLAAEFGKYDTWARNHLNRLVDAGLMEKWGKGQYRRKPVRTGEARLHVVTKGA